MKFTEALIEFLDARENAQRLAGSKAYGKSVLEAYLKATEELQATLAALIAAGAAVPQPEPPPAPRTTKRRS
jgi:hypothetical protein